jgi:hypothetical protein
LAAAEDFPEDIEWIMESATTPWRSATLGKSRVSKTVISRPLIGIAQYVIGLAKLLELLFG